MTTVLQECSREISAEMIRAYCELTDDFNPIHIDPAFAAATPMGGVIAHGTLSLNLIWRALELTFGAEGIEGAVLDIRFTRPVRVGDTITAAGRALEDGAFEVWADNQRGETVIKGTFRQGSPAV
jgi:acyl dehydratase